MSVPPKAGYFLAFSNRFGNIKVLSRTNDNLKAGDRVFIRRAGPEKHAPFLYQGFGGGTGRTAPGLAAGTPIYIDPPNDEGTGNAEVGTIQFYLDQLTEEIRRIKGTNDWRDKVDQNLTSLLYWRAPVDLISNLPSTKNRAGDIRFVREANALFVYASSGWLPLAGAGGGGSSPTTIIPNGVTNLAVGCNYLLTPAPHEFYPDRMLRRSPGVGYEPSGGLLTDNAVGGVADTEYCVGWYGSTSVRISLDLTRA